jgi:uncharacterized protein YggT (Ycf19 family)
MTEREYERERIVNQPTRLEVYRRSEVAPADAPLASDARREVYQERVSHPGGGQVVRTEEHVSEPSQAVRRAANVAWINQIIYFLFGTLNVLIGIRFVLLALAANQSSAFVQLVYGITQPFVGPFLGIFGEPTLDGSVIEWASPIAIIIYSLLAYAITRVIALAARPAVAADL